VECRSGWSRTSRSPATRALVSMATPKTRAISAMKTLLRAANRPKVGVNFAIQSKQLCRRFVFGQGAGVIMTPRGKQKTIRQPA
jgi:hypothetical protein